MRNEKVALITLGVVIVIVLSLYLSSTKDLFNNLTWDDKKSLDEYIQLGDCADVNYIGRFQVNNTVFDTSYENIAKQEGIYIEGRLYEPLKIFVDTTGTLTPPDGYENYSSDMITGFIEGLIGIKENEIKTITIPPEKAYGIWNETLAKELFSYYFGFEYYPRYNPMNFTTTIEKSMLVYYNETINLSSIYVGQIIENISGFSQTGENAYWLTMITNITENNVTITNIVENGTIIKTEGTWDNTIIIENETLFKIRADPVIGDIYGGPFSYMKVTGYNESFLFLSLNMQAPDSSFINQTLNYEIKIEKLFKTSDQEKS